MSSTSLKKVAFRGAIWTFVGYGLSQALRFGSNLILTRLLFPEVFGLMALVYVFITGLNLFSDIGIRPSIIQNPRGDDPVFLNTAWTLQVVRGIGLWLGCLILAFPVSQIYDEPKLVWLLPVVGLTTIIQGFNSTSLATLSRHVEVGKITIFQLGVQVIALAVTIIYAYFQQSIWALVIGNLLSSLFQMIISHRLNLLVTNRFAWDKTAIHEITLFGRWIFLNTAMMFLAQQSDRLILGKLLSLEMLGVYTIAFSLSDIPRQAVKRLSSNVIFPVLSKNAALPRSNLREKILKPRRQLLLMATLVLAVMTVFGDLVVLALYDDRYAQAALFFPILSLGLWPRILFNTISPSLKAIGEPRYDAYGSVLRLIFISLGLPIAFAQTGVIGAVFIIAISDIFNYIAVVYGLWRTKLLCLVQDLQATVLFVCWLMLFLLIRFVTGLELPLANAFPQ